MFFSVLCLLCLCARLFICALWSPALGFRLFVVSNCEFATFPLVSWVRCVSIHDHCTLTFFLSGNPDEMHENSTGTLYQTRCINSIKMFRIGPVTLVCEHIKVNKTEHFVPSSTATTRDDCTECSYRSEVIGIGQSQSDFVLAQLQVRGQWHWPEPK